MHQPRHIFRALGASDNAVYHGGFADDLLHAKTRIQRGIRVLENHLPFQLHGQTLARRERGDHPAPPKFFTVGRFQQADGNAPQGGFAAARFADQADYFTRKHL